MFISLYTYSFFILIRFIACQVNPGPLRKICVLKERFHVRQGWDHGSWQSAGHETWETWLPGFP